MSKTTKIILGILSILPFFLFGAYFVYLVYFFFTMAKAGVMDPSATAFDTSYMITQFVGIFVLLGLLILISMGLLIYFMVHIGSNPKAAATEKLVWILLLLFIGIPAFPFYWYLKIWKEE